MKQKLLKFHHSIDCVLHLYTHFYNEYRRQFAQCPFQIYQSFNCELRARLNGIFVESVNKLLILIYFVLFQKEKLGDITQLKGN